jgi:L-alanine-DL-glutamate epimerase-like enolase superfamily enzyme
MKITDVTLSILRTELEETVIPTHGAGIGMADLPTINEMGYIPGPQKPGLGYDIDRDKIDDLTLKRY